MKKTILLFTILLTFLECSKKDIKNDLLLESTRIKNSLLIYYDFYNRTHKSEVNSLSSAINSFASLPIISRFESAQNRWKSSWMSYQNLRIFNYFNGVIQSPNEYDLTYVESLYINPNYIDSTFLQPNNGIIMNPSIYGSILMNSIVDWHLVGSGNATIGYEPLEFLLFGEDNEQTFGGTRVHYEFVNVNQYNNRRRQFLGLSGILLNNQFSNPQLTNFETSLYNSSSSEFLSSYLNMLIDYVEIEIVDRSLRTPYLSQNQEDEICRFSDYSKQTISFQIKSVIELIFGTNQNISTKSGYFLGDLIKKLDRESYETIYTELETSSDMILGLTNPFDAAINDPSDRSKINEIISKLVVVANSLRSVSVKIDL